MLAISTRQRKINAMNIHERFMAKVNVPPGDMCWNWAGARSGSGYGQFWDGGRNIPAHWFLLESRPPKGKEACHKCDNKLCVRPSHIFIGSRSDNMKDMVSKGRHNTAPGCRAMLSKRDTRGSKNHQSKLTEEQVAEIKSAPTKRGTQAALSRRLGVTEACISAIRRGVNRA